MTSMELSRQHESYRSEVRQIVYRQKASCKIFKCHERNELKIGCHRTQIHSSRREFNKVSQNSEKKHTDSKEMKKRKETCFMYQELQKQKIKHIRKKKSLN